MISGFLQSLVAAIALIWISYLAYRTLRTDALPLNLMTFLFLMIILGTFLLLGAGLAGALRGDIIARASIVAILLLASLPAKRLTAIQALADVRRVWGETVAWWRGLDSWIRWLGGLFLGFLFARSLFLTWALPPFIWDALTYHLTNVAHWIQAGRIEVFDTPVTRIFTPANYEVLASGFAVFFHHDAWIEASGLPALALAILAVYIIGRRIGLDETSSFLAALGYASTPGLILMITGTKNDPYIAAAFLGAMAIILDLSFRPGEGPERNIPGQMIMLAVILLYALGTKTFIVHLSAGLLVLLGITAWRGRRIGFWLQTPRWLWRALRPRGGSAGGIRALILGVALFLGTYWYVRNWLLTGNPLYPYGISVRGVEIIETDFGAANVGLGNLIQNLKGLAFKFGDKQAPIVPDLPNTTGWGWVAYGLGVPAFLWGLVRAAPVRILAISFVSALLALFYTSTTSPWNMRYAIWFPALFSLAFAAFFHWMPQEWRRLRTAFAGLFILCLALNYSITMSYNRISIDIFAEMLSRPLRGREAALLPVNVPDEYANALEFVPRDDLMGYNVHKNGFVYPLFRSDFSQRLVFVPISEEDGCEEIAQRMENRGTRWLIVAPEHTLDAHIAKLRDCSDSDTRIRERARGVYVLR